MNALPDDIVFGNICQHLDPIDYPKFSLVNKKFNNFINQHAKEQCVRWWKDLKLYQNNLDSIFPLDTVVFPVLKQVECFHNASWKALWMALQSEIDIWNFENSRTCSQRGYEKASTFIIIGIITVTFPGWSWSGPHIKVARIRTLQG
jgi:hypothetical protein